MTETDRVFEWLRGMGVEIPVQVERLLAPGFAGMFHAAERRGSEAMRRHVLSNLGVVLDGMARDLSMRPAVPVSCADPRSEEG